MDGIFDSPMPLGFGMALAANEQAMQKFSSLSKEKREELIRQTKSVSSRKEMRSLVDSIAKGNIYG